MTLSPLFALTLGGLDTLHASGTFRAVFGPVGAWGEQRPADGAPFGVQAVEQGRFQFLVQRQHRRPEPPAQQGVGNGLDADTFLPIIQRDTVAAVIVAALMYQPPRSAVLVVVHDGDGFRLAFLHAGTSHTRRSCRSPGRHRPPAPGRWARLPVPAARGQGAGRYSDGRSQDSER